MSNVGMGRRITDIGVRVNDGPAVNGRVGVVAGRDGDEAGRSHGQGALARTVARGALAVVAADADGLGIGLVDPDTGLGFNPVGTNGTGEKGQGGDITCRPAACRAPSRRHRGHVVDVQAVAQARADDGPADVDAMLPLQWSLPGTASNRMPMALMLTGPLP
jgi:hypothetical protein